MTGGEIKMSDHDPEKNPPAGEDVFETPTTWNHRVLMTEQDGEKSYCIHDKRLVMQSCHQ